MDRSTRCASRRTTTTPNKLGPMGRTGTGSTTGLRAASRQSRTSCPVPRHVAGRNPLPARGGAWRGVGAAPAGLFQGTECAGISGSARPLISHVRFHTTGPRTSFVNVIPRIRRPIRRSPRARAGELSTRAVRREKNYLERPVLSTTACGWDARAGKDGTGDRTAVTRDADPSPRHQPPCDATDKRRGEHMARLKRLVGITLAVVIAAALVIYVLRPTASPGPSSLVGNDPGTTTGHPKGDHNKPPAGGHSQPPTDEGTCAGSGHGHGHGHGHDGGACGTTKDRGHHSEGKGHTKSHDKHGHHSDGSNASHKDHSRHGGHDSNGHDSGKGDHGSHGDD